MMVTIGSFDAGRRTTRFAVSTYEFLAKRDLRLVLLGTLVFCGVYLASLGINYLGSFVSCLLTQKMVFRIRVSLLRQIHTFPTHRHEKSQVGDTIPIEHHLNG